MSQSTSVCPYPSSYHISLPVYILHASKCHHTHSSIYLHSPSSSKVHLCFCKRSVKSQMMGLILGWRPKVTTLLMAVLTILKCLYKIRQSSSYHHATIWVSVLCPIPSLRSVTSEDRCNIPNCFHMALQGILELPASLCCVEWHNRLAQMLHIFVLLILSRKFSFIRTAVPILYVNHYKWVPARRSIHE